MRLPIQLGLLPVLFTVAGGQAQPDIGGILKKLSDTYKTASQYELVMEVTETTLGTGQSKLVHSLVAVKAPDRYRVESPGSLGKDGKTSSGMTVVLDGITIWFYDPVLNQYASYPASAIGSDLPDELETSGVDYVTMSRYRDAAKNAVSAEYLRDEEIEIGGAKVACYVVSVPDRNTQYTWWIDKKNSHVVREDSDSISTVFTTIRLGEALPNELFKFEPPPGARKNGRDQR